MPASISEYVPQYAGHRRRALSVWGVAAAAALLIVVGVISAPLLARGGYELIARGVYGGFSAVCHQMPERSFYALGFPLAVCARCAGLYAGFVVGVILYPLVRPLSSREMPARAWLVMAALPMALDVALGTFGLWANTHLSRSLTGVLLGLATAFYVVPGLVDFSYVSWKGSLRLTISSGKGVKET